MRGRLVKSDQRVDEAPIEVVRRNGVVLVQLRLPGAASGGCRVQVHVQRVVLLLRAPNRVAQHERQLGDHSADTHETRYFGQVKSARDRGRTRHLSSRELVDPVARRHPERLARQCVVLVSGADNRCHLDKRERTHFNNVDTNERGTPRKSSLTMMSSPSMYCGKSPFWLPM